MIRRILKIVAAVLTLQVVIGGTIGLLVPFSVLAAMPVYDYQKLVETSTAIVMPSALAIDCVLFAGVAFGLWRRRPHAIKSPPLPRSIIHPSERVRALPRFMQPRRGRAA